MVVPFYYYQSVGDAYDPLVQCGYRHVPAQERTFRIKTTLDWDRIWSLKGTTTWMLDPPAVRCVLLWPRKYDATNRIDTCVK